MEYIVFDIESNGLQGTDVLSISAIRFAVDGKVLKEVGRYNRYYYRHPNNRPNVHAIRVNKLGSEKLIKLRQGVEYPLYFIEDIGSFIEFCWGTRGFVAHNLQFDRSFLPFKIQNGFCTLVTARENKIKRYKGKDKKLTSLIEHYEIPIDSSKLHTSMYDTEMLYEILKRMLAIDEEGFKIFLENSNEKESLHKIPGFYNDISYKDHYYYYKGEEKAIDLYDGKMDVSALYTQFLEKGCKSINISAERMKSQLKPYMNSDKKVELEGVHFFLNNLSLFIKTGKRGMTADEKLKVVFTRGNIGIMQLIQDINKVLPLEERMFGSNFNNYLVRRGILSRANRSTVINSSSYEYGIIGEDRINEKTGEVRVMVKYTDKGKAFILENYEWILGLVDGISCKYEKLECLSEPNSLVTEDSKLEKLKLIRKELRYFVLNTPLTIEIGIDSKLKEGSLFSVPSEFVNENLIVVDNYELEIGNHVVEVKKDIGVVKNKYLR